MTSPRITVIIPTRERGEVLEASLRTLTRQDFDGLDILVSDNCSKDCTAEIVRATHDSRVRYVNTGKRVSMSHNWEFALSHVPVDDRYVMVLGDDDGIIPGALVRIAELIRETRAQALNSTFVTYIWPSDQNRGMGRLLVPMCRGYEVRNSLEWLKKAVQGLAWYSELPMLYVGGVIHMSLLDEVRRRKGAFFHSCQPDVFSSVALSCIADRYVFSHDPFAIAGHSRHSNGASWNAAAGSTSDTSDACKPKQIFLSEPNIPWHSDVPTIEGGGVPFSVDLLVYESYLQSEYLHDDILKLDKSDMLALFLARRIPDQERMNKWINLFAERHGLDMEKARRKASTRRWRITLSRLIEYSKAFRDVYRLEPAFGLKIRDVYEASIIAATLLRTRPTRLPSYTGTLAKHLVRSRGAMCSVP